MWKQHLPDGAYFYKSLVELRKLQFVLDVEESRAAIEDLSCRFLAELGTQQLVPVAESFQNGNFDLLCLLQSHHHLLFVLIPACVDSHLDLTFPHL